MEAISARTSIKHGAQDTCCKETPEGAPIQSIDACELLIIVNFFPCRTSSVVITLEKEGMAGSWSTLTSTLLC